MFTVYVHMLPNNKVYIGITGRKNLNDRWQNGKAYRNNQHFTNAINKYGWENITHEILFSGLTKEQAEQKEIELIALYDSTNPAKGYNIAKGGKTNSGFKHTKETKDKIACSLMGVKHTKERCKNQSKALKEVWKNEQYRERMIKAHLGKQRGSNHSMSIKVNRYDLDGNFIDSFESIRDAERKTGIDHRQISNCCKGKQKFCCGYIWGYVG